MEEMSKILCENIEKMIDEAFSPIQRELMLLWEELEDKQNEAKPVVMKEDEEAVLTHLEKIRSGWFLWRR